MAFVYSNLAIALRHTGRMSEAGALFEKAIAAARKNKHRTLGPSLADLAEIRCKTGHPSEAAQLLGEAAKVTRADYPDTPWRSAWVENIRGECLLVAGHAREGRRAIAVSSPVILKTWPDGTLFSTEARRRSKMAAD